MVYWRLNGILCGLALLLSAAPALAERGFVELTKGQKTFVDYEPAQPGRPTLVLLNGLTYSTKSWDAYVKAIRKRDQGVGILRYDMIGMGETLLNNRLPVNYDIPYLEQVEQLKKLLTHLRLKKVHLAGLSYGGGLAVAFGAEYPEHVASLILMAPFTEPLKAMDDWIRQEVAMTRLTFPFNPASDDELYDFFLRRFIYATYPGLEPVVLENPYKLEAVFRMVQGIRKYVTFRDLKRIPEGSLHLMVAGEDQYIKREVLDKFWRLVPRANRASRIDIDHTEHKIPEAVPGYAAAWTLEVMSGRAELSDGRVFEGNVRDFSATSGETKIELSR